MPWTLSSDESNQCRSGLIRYEKPENTGKNDLSAENEYSLRVDNILRMTDGDLIVPHHRAHAIDGVDGGDHMLSRNLKLDSIPFLVWLRSIHGDKVYAHWLFSFDQSESDPYCHSRSLILVRQAVDSDEEEGRVVHCHLVCRKEAMTGVRLQKSRWSWAAMEVCVYHAACQLRQSVF